MRFIEKISAFFFEIIADLFCNPFRISVCNNFSIQLLRLFFYKFNILFADSLSKLVSPSVATASKFPDNIHELFLINHTTISLFQNRFHVGMDVGYCLFTVFAIDIVFKSTHAIWTIQCQHGRNIFEVCRFQPQKQIAHTAAFNLEHAICPCACKQFIHCRVIRELRIVYTEIPF